MLIMKFISLSEILDSLIETVRGEVDDYNDYSYSYYSHQNFDIVHLKDELYQTKKEDTED